MQGIPFSPDVWKAKLRVLKEKGEAQTRRLSGLKEINQSPNDWELELILENEKFKGIACFLPKGRSNPTLVKYVKPPYHIGETYYVKEAWAVEKKYNHLKPSEIPETATIYYESDGVGEWPINLSIGKWRSPMFMSAWAARHFITITGIKAERLQSITDREAIAEGIDFSCTQPDSGCGCNRRAFARLWNSLNPQYPWSLNPWVFAYTLKLVERDV